MTKITLAAYREAAQRHYALKAERDALDVKINAAAAVVREGSGRWGAVAVTDTVSLSVSAPSERRTLDHDRSVAMLKALGASDEDIASLYKITPVAGSVKYRKIRPEDR